MVRRLRLVSFLVFAALSVVATATSAQTAADRRSPQADSSRQAVERLLQPWNRPDAPGVAVSVTVDGTIAAQLAIGEADLEQGAMIGPHSVFEAASISKQFTAFAVLLLEQDGLLALDDPVSKYLPEMARFDPITLRQLMTHTSGLRDGFTLLTAAGWREEDFFANEQVFDMIVGQKQLNFAPGTAFQYDNSGYALLAEVVRRVSGFSLADFCEARIFEPLGMRHTRFQTDIADIVPARVHSYDVRKDGYRREVLNSVVSGPSGLLTSVGDLSRWALNLETGTLGGPALLRRMEEQAQLPGGATIYYALGQEFHAYKGLRSWSHGGRDAGFRSFLLRVPDQRFSVAILANRDDVDAAEIAYRIADIYLADRAVYRPAPVDESRPSPEDLAAYAGDYQLYPGVIFNLRKDGNRLLFTHMGQSEPVTLPALSRREFQLDAARHLSLVFDLPVKGRSPGLAYTIGLNGSLPAPRIELAPLPAPGGSLGDFTGRYFSRELRTEYLIVVDGGALLIRHPRRPTIRLRAYQRDMFMAIDGTPAQLRFLRSASGQVTGFSLSVPLAENIGFERARDI